MEIPRKLDLHAIFRSKSAFLFGPRSTGKSWLIRKLPDTIKKFNLLNSDTFLRLSRRPVTLGEELDSDDTHVVIDEIQKLPILLDEVHRLIEERGTIFLLTGSSARKLRHGGANLLAGRARYHNLFSLTWQELGRSFNLLKYCNIGGIPQIWLSDLPWKDLQDYVHLYIREEINAEAVVRNIGAFARFLDIFGRQSGEELNYQELASDSAVPVRTVSSYVEVLIDTLLAFELKPFVFTKSRKAVSRSKLYIFDVGVANVMGGIKDLRYHSQEFGRAFEHFIIQEIRAALSYQLTHPWSDKKLYYWRTYQGDEVDLIIGDELAIEIKASENFQPAQLKGLQKLRAEDKVKRYILLSRIKERRLVQGIELWPWEDFLRGIWKAEI